MLIIMKMIMRMIFTKASAGLCRRKHDDDDDDGNDNDDGDNDNDDDDDDDDDDNDNDFVQVSAAENIFLEHSVKIRVRPEVEPEQALVTIFSSSPSS